ncbi:MAG: ATP-binding protein, partial [Gemmataceae bacterium]
VSYRDKNGRFAERFLRDMARPGDAGRTLRGKSVRTLDGDDFVAIVNQGLSETLDPDNRIRLELDERYIDDTTAALLADEFGERRIEQILVNLVINARQAMPNGGRLRVEVGENPAGDTVEVKIADTGTGIAPEHLRQIFEPFFTTKAPDEYGRGGTGLGLSVCRQIIEAHHGRIRVESVVGKGSTFTVKLPKHLPEDRG